MFVVCSHLRIYLSDFGTKVMTLMPFFSKITIPWQSDCLIKYSNSFGCEGIPRKDAPKKLESLFQIHKFWGCRLTG